MEKQKYSIKTDFTMLAILIIPVSVAVNVVGGQLAQILKLPIYLDTIGTTFAGMLCGPWVGAIAGGLTNIVTGITNPVQFAFAPVNILAGLTVGFLARKDMFSAWWKWIISIVIMSLVAIVSSTPIVVLVYGGVTGSGTSLITAAVMAAGADIWAAVIGTDGLVSIIDRALASIISILVIKVIPARTLVKFGCGQNYIKEKKDA